MTTLAPIRLSSDDLQQCIHCGMCLEACPTYLISGLETESPRGRIHLMGALAAGRIGATDKTLLHLDRCLACRACEAVCPSGVRYGRLIETTRAELERLHARPRGVVGGWLRRAMLATLADPRALGRAAAVLSLYARTGLRRLVRGTVLRRLLPHGLRRLEALYPPFDRPRYRAPAAPERPVARVALLLGCVMRVAYGDVHTAAARVLARRGVAVQEVGDQVCCGALHAHAGDRETAQGLARRNIDAFERARIDALVVDAAGCGAHLKGYGELLADDPAYAGRAAALAGRVRDVTEYLAGLPRASFGALPIRVTYQDPCHLAHAQRIRSEPRELLAAVEGLELVEMAEADVCCGSAGSYNLEQPQWSDRLLARKVDAIIASGASAVVTANPGCMLQIEAGLRERGAGIPVLHVVEILDRASRA